MRERMLGGRRGLVIFCIALLGAAALGITVFERRGERYSPKMPGLAEAPVTELRFDAPTEPYIGVPTLAPVSAHRFLFANFRQVYLLSSDSGDVTLMRAIGLTAPGDYQPAGLYFDRGAQRLYVAGYLRNDIMVFDVDLAAHTLRWRETIRDPAMISPEGIWYDAPSHILVTADFDGNAVTAFRLGGDRPSLLWKHPLPEAHGIAVVGDRVYATDLVDRVLVELDLQTGTERRRAGSLGWDAGRGAMLWPTSIYPDGRGHLVISDADTGAVSIRRLSDLSVVAAVGANGMGRAWLNQPYATVVEGDEFLTISTKQFRFVLGRYPELVATRSFMRSAKDWAAPVPDLRLGGPGWVGYHHVGGIRIRVFGHELMVQSSRLVVADRTAFPSLYLNAPWGEHQFKILQAAQVGDRYLLLSPQSYERPLIMAERNGRLYAEQFFGGGNDCWIAGTDIHCPTQTIPVASLTAAFDKYVTDLEAVRCRDGALTPQALLGVYGPYGGEGKATIELLTRKFTSPAGQTVRDAFLALGDCAADPAALRDAARRYLDELPRQSAVSLDELSLVSILW